MHKPMILAKISQTWILIFILTAATDAIAGDKGYGSRFSGKLDIQVDTKDVKNLFEQTNGSTAIIDIGRIQKSTAGGDVKSTVRTGEVTNKVTNASNSRAKISIGSIENSDIGKADINVTTRNVTNEVLGGANNKATVRIGSVSNARATKDIAIDLTVKQDITNTINSGTGNRSVVSIGSVGEDSDEDRGNKPYVADTSHSHAPPLVTPSKRSVDPLALFQDPNLIYASNAGGATNGIEKNQIRDQQEYLKKLAEFIHKRRSIVTPGDPNFLNRENDDKWGRLATYLTTCDARHYPNGDVKACMSDKINHPAEYVKMQIITVEKLTFWFAPLIRVPEVIRQPGVNWLFERAAKNNWLKQIETHKEMSQLLRDIGLLSDGDFKKRMDDLEKLKNKIAEQLSEIQEPIPPNKRANHHTAPKPKKDEGGDNNHSNSSITRSGKNGEQSERPHIGSSQEQGTKTIWNPSGIKSGNCVACVASYLTDKLKGDNNTKFKTADELEQQFGKRRDGVQIAEANEFMMKSLGMGKWPEPGHMKAPGHYVVYIGHGWRSTQGAWTHVIYAEKLKTGELKFFDPQNGSTFDGYQYLTLKKIHGGKDIAYLVKETQ